MYKNVNIVLIYMFDELNNMLYFFG